MVVRRMKKKKKKIEMRYQIQGTRESRYLYWKNNGKQKIIKWLMGICDQTRS